MTQTWRLLPFLEASGSLQMAIDRWLLQQHRQNQQPPCLRFYAWFPVAISLGYHQHCYPPHWQSLTWQGQEIDLVRRPTGGRAVLHHGDLTYMVVTSGFKSKRFQVYRQICQFLIDGWRSLGLELHYGQAERGYIHHPNCFGTATSADLVDNEGHKRIGSAQLKQGGAILQHGSMILYADSLLFQQIFGESPPISLNLPLLKNSTSAILKGNKNEETQNFKELLIQRLIEAAEECFEVKFELKPLSESEWQEIKQDLNFFKVTT